MKRNLGTTDKLIRFAIAFLAVTLYLSDYITGTLAIALLAVLMATALLNFCPLYSLFRINTSKRMGKF